MWDHKCSTEQDSHKRTKHCYAIVILAPLWGWRTLFHCYSTKSRCLTTVGRPRCTWTMQTTWLSPYNLQTRELWVAWFSCGKTNFWVCYSIMRWYGPPAVFKTSVPIQNGPLGSFGSLWVPEGLLSLQNFWRSGRKAVFPCLSSDCWTARLSHTYALERNSQHSALKIVWQTPALAPTDVLNWEKKPWGLGIFIHFYT